jgi:hypothetical protein
MLEEIEIFLGDVKERLQTYIDFANDSSLKDEIILTIDQMNSLNAMNKLLKRKDRRTSIIWHFIGIPLIYEFYICVSVWYDF